MYTNNIEPVYFRVSIDPTDLDGSGSSDQEKKGFIDHKHVMYYDTHPSTYENSLNKARANMRYDKLIMEVSENISPWLTVAHDNKGATADSPGSGFEMTLVYDKEHFVYTYNELFVSKSETPNEKQILKGAEAVKRQVARVFANTYKQFMQVYDPRSTTDTGHEAWTDRTVYIVARTPSDMSTPEERVSDVETNITVDKITNLNSN